MPCYIQKSRPPSRDEYEAWQKIGYLGTWDQYSAAKNHEIGGTKFICGDLGPHCTDCAGFGDFLCDYPVGNGKTCDRAMCDDHATEIAPEVHYCAGHLKLWREFVEAGGVKSELENVIAFKAHKRATKET